MKAMLFAVAAFSVTGIAAAANPIVALETSMGTIKIELFEDKAPVTVKNFLSYVDDKFYDGTIFHRVIRDFMVQGGGLEPGLREKKTKPPIVNESTNGLGNERGTVAMARSKEANSATSQFFINVVVNRRLDRNQAADGVGYCVFGKVVEGMDVVDKIRAVKTGGKDTHHDVPVDDVLLKSVRRTEAKKPENSTPPVR